MNDDIFDKPSEAEIDKIHEVDLKEKMETFYIDYAMSVIASRAPVSYTHLTLPTKLEV